MPDNLFHVFVLNEKLCINTFFNKYTNVNFFKNRNTVYRIMPKNFMCLLYCFSTSERWSVSYCFSVWERTWWPCHLGPLSFFTQLLRFSFRDLHTILFFTLWLGISSSSFNWLIICILYRFWRSILSVIISVSKAIRLENVIVSTK